MDYRLKYGKSEVVLSIDEKNVISVLELNQTKFKPIQNIQQELISSLTQPLGCEPLEKIVKVVQPKQITIVVEDITRANPYYPEILRLLTKYLSLWTNSVIKFVIALGTHRPHTEQENKKLYGEDIVSKFEFINHNCDDVSVNEYIGTTSFGNRIYLNKNVTQADLVILTGSIDTHSFAGYSGTRKALLPGVAARSSITYNHSLVIEDGSTMGELEHNKINLDMLSAANIFVSQKPTFVINFIKNDRKQIVKILAGELNSVYSEGTKIAKEIFCVRIKELADVTFVSCGGYPRDINLYQAQKSLTCATLTTKKDGSIVLIAECSEGIGQEIFGNWLVNYDIEEILSFPRDKIVVEGHRAYLTAKILKNYNCILVSSLESTLVSKLKFYYAENLNKAVKIVEQKFAKNYKSYIIPDGSSILPLLQ